MSRKVVADKPQAHFRLRISAGETVAIGPGKIALLEAIGDTGSLTAAAKQLDMSYRRAWLLLDDLNRALKKPAVASAIGGQHGGGSQLTETGLALVAHYRSVEATASEACAPEMRKLLSLLAR